MLPFQWSHPRHLIFDPLRFSAPAARPAPEDRATMIAKAAYFRAERRNFEAGHEVDDWLAAEAEVDWRLAKARYPGEAWGPARGR